MAWWEWLIMGAAIGLAHWELYELRVALTLVDARRIRSFEDVEMRLSSLERLAKGPKG